VEWWEGAKRIQRPAGQTSGDALDAWVEKTAELNGTLDVPEEDYKPVSLTYLSVTSAIATYLSGVKGTKSPATLDACLRFIPIPSSNFK